MAHIIWVENPSTFERNVPFAQRHSIHVIFGKRVVGAFFISKNSFGKFFYESKALKWIILNR